MAEAADWIGVEWQDAGVRAHVIGAGGALLETRSAPGGGAVHSVLADLIGDLRPESGILPVIACGLPDTDTRAVPCTALPTGLHAVPGPDPRFAIYPIPGLRQDRPVDSVYGPETAIAGFLAGTPDFDGVLCLPGPISTWARISAGEVVSFMTTLTGELFGLLARQSSLRHSVPADGWDAAAFEGALGDSLSRPERLAMMLSMLRGGGAGSRARLSGLLIGAELASARPWWLGQTVAIVGGGDLAGHYAAALATQGVQASISGQDMTLAGLACARALLRGA